MNKIAVVYNSTYGYSKKYAEWLVDALRLTHPDVQIFDGGKTEVKKLLPFDVIIYMSGLYAGSVNGLSLFANNKAKLENKQICLCTVGLTAPGDRDEIQRVHQKALAKWPKSAIAFHLPGGMNQKNLSFLHRNMTKLIVSQLNKQSSLTPLEKIILESSKSPVDFTSQEALSPVVHWVERVLKQ